MIYKGNSKQKSTNLKTISENSAEKLPTWYTHPKQKWAIQVAASPIALFLKLLLPQSDKTLRGLLLQRSQKVDPIILYKLAYIDRVRLKPCYETIMFGRVT